MSHNNDSEVQRTGESEVKKSERKGGKKAKKRVLVVRPKIVVSKSTFQRPNNSADESKSKGAGSNIHRMRKKAPRLVRRTKRGKGTRRRRRERKSGEGGEVGLKEPAEEEDLREAGGGGCYCSQLKEGLREEGETRRCNHIERKEKRFIPFFEGPFFRVPTPFLRPFLRDFYPSLNLF